MSPEDMETGRIRQKIRTRQALLEAAWRLLSQGWQPTVAEVAEEALVSRATAYRYFPDRERLLIEAVLEQRLAAAAPVPLGDSGETSSDRVARVQKRLFDQVVRNETLFRLSLRASLNEWIANKDKSRFILRGDQRLALVETALESERTKISPADFEMLTHALTTMIGLEPFIVLRDVCQLRQKRASEIMNWAVRKLVDAVLGREKPTDC